MTDRKRGDFSPPNPAEWATYIDRSYIHDDKAHHLLAELEADGYVIVHPDDVPNGLGEYGRYPGEVESARRIGWDDCRRHIFGGSDG